MLFVFAICVSDILQGQTTYIFNDDSLKKAKFIGGRLDNSLNQSYIVIPFSNLKRNLPNGKYIVVDLNRKDSSKKELSNFIEMKGYYKDSLKQGGFEYYHRFKINGKWINKLTDLYTYKNGLLSGYYFSSNSLYKYVEGYYKNGKKNGFFITYDFYSGKIKKIELYLADTLKYRVKYRNGKMQPLEIDPKVFNSNYLENDNMPIRRTKK